MGVEFGRQPCIDPAEAMGWCQAQGLPTPWLGRANSFRCPIGQTAGAGVILLTRASLDALGLDTPRDLVFSDGNIDGGRTVTLKNLSIVRARAFSPGRRDDPTCGYWCEIADRRRRCKARVIDKAYNVRSTPGTEDYYSATLNAGVAWTWSQMAQNIWETVGTSLLGAWPGLPFTPHGTPVGFSFYGWYAWDALGVVLDRIGCAIRLDPITDSFSIVRLSLADSTAEAALTAHDHQRTFDGEPLDSVAGTIPETVRVLFPRSEETADTTGASPWYISDQNDPSGDDEGIAPGTYALIADDLPARHNAAGSILNGSEIDERAAERAADFYRRARHERRLRCYSGARQSGGLLPGSQIALTCWYDLGDGVKTEVFSVPGTPQPGLVGLPGAGQGGGLTINNFASQLFVNNYALAGDTYNLWDVRNFDLWQIDNGINVWSYQLNLLIQSAPNILNIILALATSTGFSGAKVRLTTSQTVPNASLHEIVWDEEEFDTDDYFDAGSPTKLTAPVSGFYCFGGNVSLTPSGAGIGANEIFEMTAGIRKNGAPAGDGSDILAFEWNQDAHDPGTAPEGSAFSLSGIAYLEAGDYIELACTTEDVSGGGSPVDGLLAATGTTADPNFWIFRLVPPGGAGGGAPLSAEYITGAAHADLTAERVATDTTSIDVDLGTAGQAKWKRAALTGDVTASADSNATTIANNAVTYAKMQDVSTDGRVLGRFTSGAGDVEEGIVAGTNSGMILSGNSLLNDFALDAEMEAGAATHKVVRPSNFHRHPGVAKFWVVFDGDGGATISASYNVTSVTRNGVGDYTVTIANDFSSANWVPWVFLRRPSGAPNSQIVGYADKDNAQTAGAIRVLTTNLAGTAADCKMVAVGGFGDL